jgi:predicted acyl esterase
MLPRLIALTLAATCCAGMQAPVPSTATQAGAPPAAIADAGKPARNTREVRIPREAGVELAGTLTLPAGKGPFPAVAFITGSGAQDRDETIFGKKPFKAWAEAFADAGVASLRVDDRGMGASGGSLATFTTLDIARDAAATLAFLRMQPGIDPARCGLLGHSEGSAAAILIASGAAREPDAPAPALLVLVAGAGRDGMAVLEEQTRVIYRTMQADAALKKVAIERHHEMCAAIKAGADEATLRTRLQALVEAQLAVIDTKSAPEQRASKATLLTTANLPQMNSPWMRWFVANDPCTEAVRCKLPCLSVNGSMDTQVSAEHDQVPLVEALRKGGCVVAVRTPEDMNHLLQPCNTGAVNEYATIAVDTDAGEAKAMGEWIAQTAKAINAPATTH